MGKIDTFFEFEVTNGLFDKLDDNGHRPWESIRYVVCSHIVNSFCSIHQTHNQELSVFKWVIKYVHLSILSVFYIIRHRHCSTMFMLSSRDKKEGLYFDKISDAVYDMVDKTKTFAIETTWHFNDYQYRNYTCPNNILLIIKALIRNKYHFNFEEIYSLLKSNFPNFDLTIGDLNSQYLEFKAQYLFYRFLFRFCGIQKVFMVQNGIQKGLIAAAKELGVEVLEFQHAQISKNHPAYSYPDNEKITANTIYHPSKLLTFGTFWHKDRCYPGVKNVVIGNNSYCGEKMPQQSITTKSILVISNIDDGEMLCDFVKSINSIDPFCFYFKLHPNQYSEKAYYEQILKEQPNVKVLTNEYSINMLLSITQGVLLVQSTVELEALKMGRRVYVIKYGAYELMDFVFKEDGVTLIENANDFIECYRKYENEELPLRDDLFTPFNPAVAEELI